MLFNSLDFAIFLPIVFTVYWILKDNLKYQNIALLIASYIFYGWWNYKFLFLIILSSIIDYIVGIKLNSDSQKRKQYLLLSIISNLGILGVFKYYNFFISNFNEAFTFFGQDLQFRYLDIILPVGISFYTFQTMSYSIDVYKGKMEATKDFIAFSTYVAFFPQLVAGPIERAKDLLPQFFNKKVFSETDATSGLQQMLWGFFKKMVIADNSAVYANEIFNNYTTHNGSTLLLGTFFFTLQIYGDFSGYSDIAIGLSRLFGFNLNQNFAFPYFSRDIAEFWRRWHISLSSWFRDYVYIPLGGSRGSVFKKIRNVMIIFILSGFWHGANWTYIVWGGLNALYFLPLILSNNNRNNLEFENLGRGKIFLKNILSILLTFCLTMIAWIYFRSESVSMANNILTRIFSSSFFEIPDYFGGFYGIQTLFLILFFMIIEWNGRKGKFGIENIRNLKNNYRRWSYYVIITLMIFVFGKFENSEFIYFAF